MASEYNRNLRRLIGLTREMMALADEGDRDRNDDTCGIIYGIRRDSASRGRKLAEAECERHRQSGKWDDEEDIQQGQIENRRDVN